MSPRLQPLLCLLPLPFVLLLGGCGGSGLLHVTPPQAELSPHAGQATFAVKWPARTAVTRLNGRLIPLACNSIVLTITHAGPVVLSQTLPRPANGTSSTVTLSNLPAGTLTASASAYPTAVGTGVVQASATLPLVITNGSSTPLTLTLADTITTLTVTSSSQNLAIGGTIPLVATAYNAAGAVVLTSGSITWSSPNYGTATVSSGGVVTGVSVGIAAVTATDSESGVSGSFIVDPIASAPFGAAPAAVPGTVQAVNYDLGGEGVAYHDTDPANLGTHYRNDGVDIATCSDGGTGYSVGYTTAGEWLKFTLNIATAKTYTVAFRVAAISSTKSFHLENSAGTNLTGTVVCPNTGSFNTFATVNATASLPAGVQTLKLVEEPELTT